MNKAMLSLLTESELLLVRETETAALALLDEDATGDLLVRVRRARNKYSTNYRRQSAKRVVAKGSRGAARGSSNKTAMKAEIFEEALARVSRRLATLARQSATDLKAERLAAARGAAPVGSAASRGRTATTSVRKAPPAVTPTTKSLRTPSRKKQVASSGAAGARRQAKRDGS
jgi:hypothetical protein